MDSLLKGFSFTSVACFFLRTGGVEEFKELEMDFFDFIESAFLGGRLPFFSVVGEISSSLGLPAGVSFFSLISRPSIFYLYQIHSQ